MTVRVGIIGAGPAGLITALALEKATSPTPPAWSTPFRSGPAVRWTGWVSRMRR